MTSPSFAGVKLARVYDDGLGGVNVKLVQPGARTELSYVTSCAVTASGIASKSRTLLNISLISLISSNILIL